jgi:GNAT superfamily N-acetyltransferase
MCHPVTPPRPVRCRPTLEGDRPHDADGDLPVPGVYGVPEQWPHIVSLYQRAGLTHADIGNLHIAEQQRRRGVATWLLGRAADWLRLAQVERLLNYAWLEGQDPTSQDYTGYRAFLAASGFSELTRTKRGWTRTPHEQ